MLVYSGAKSIIFQKQETNNIFNFRMAHDTNQLENEFPCLEWYT